MEWTLLLEWGTKLLISFLPTLPKSLIGIVSGYLARKTWSLIMPEKCVIDGCTGKVGQVTRGLCAKCYKIACDKVISGQTSWEELAELGLCSNEGLDPFSKAFNRAKGVNKEKTANEVSIDMFGEE